MTDREEWKRAIKDTMGGLKDGQHRVVAWAGEEGDRVVNAAIFFKVEDKVFACDLVRVPWAE